MLDIYNEKSLSESWWEFNFEDMKILQRIDYK